MHTNALSRNDTSIAVLMLKNPFPLFPTIPEQDIMNICDPATRQTLRTAYIISHGYPSNYGQHLNCHCNITTEPNQKMLLTFSDFAIEWSEGCQKDVLHIRDGGEEMVRCGRLLRNHNITSRSNRLDLELVTDGWKEHKGFWLQVEGTLVLYSLCGFI